MGRVNCLFPRRFVPFREQTPARLCELIYPTSNGDFLRTKRIPSAVHLKAGDVLISSIGMGSIGKVSLVMDAKDLITVSEVTILRDPSIAPEFLFAYLRSETGQRQINREITGATGQQHLLKNKVARIVIPPPSDHPHRVSAAGRSCRQNSQSRRHLIRLP
jgi:hypothetical protein